jgi:hypothetical protein
VGLGNVGPEYILVYLEEWWRPNHAGRKQAEPGPDAVKEMLSSLSGWFSRLGRVGPYNLMTGVGNPCDVPWVADYRKGYTRLSMLEGFEATAAVPLSADKYGRLCEYLWSLVSSAPDAGAELLYCRDLLCAQFMFQTAYRGFDTGRLALADFRDPALHIEPDRGLPFPPPWDWAPGRDYTLCVRERGTKTARVERAPAVYLAPNYLRPALCFPQTFAYHVWRAS